MARYVLFLLLALACAHAPPAETKGLPTLSVRVASNAGLAAELIVRHEGTVVLQRPLVSGDIETWWHGSGAYEIQVRRHVARFDLGGPEPRVELSVDLANGQLDVLVGDSRAPETQAVAPLDPERAKFIYNLYGAGDHEPYELPAGASHEFDGWR